MSHKTSHAKFGPLVVLGVTLAGLSMLPVNHSDVMQNNLLGRGDLVAVTTSKAKANNNTPKDAAPVKNAFQQFKWADVVQPTPTPAPPPQAQAKKELKLPESENTDLPDLIPRDFMQLNQNFTKKDNGGKPIERRGFYVDYDNKNIGNKPTGDFDFDIVLTCSRGDSTKDISFNRKNSSIKPGELSGNFFLVDEDWCPFEQVQKVTVIDDPHNKIEELDEKNNSWTYNVQRDLTVQQQQQLDIVLNQNDPNVDYAFQVYYNPQQSQGSKEPAGRVDVKVTLNFNSNGKPMDYDFYVTPDLYFNPGWSYGGSIKVPRSIGTYDKLNKVTIAVDPFHRVPETDENNNVWSYNVEHDWTLKQGSLEVTDGRGQEYSMTVWFQRTNLKNDPIHNNDVDADVILTFKNGMKTVDKIYHERNAIGAFDILREWGAKADLVAVKVILDPDNLIMETDEANNEAHLYFNGYKPSDGQEQMMQVQH